MTKTIIIPKPDLARSEITLLRRYLTESHRFSGQEWHALRQAIDKLARAEVQFGAQHYRFAQFYRAFINGTYAYPFLTELTKLADIERDGLNRQAQTARQIWEWLQLNGIQAGTVPHAEYLIVFCLYQWGAFARGYIFEAAVLRDLQRAGVEMTPHHPIHERFAPYDLHIPNLGYGDVKTSSYFLDDLTANSPTADFYITRLYIPQTHQYQRVVFITPRAWHRFHDQASPQSLATSLPEAVQQFPRTVRLSIEPLTWIVVEYEAWKHILLEK
jgi:hypothetical protein